jgi:lipopolysaccharide export system protein LptA
VFLFTTLRKYFPLLLAIVAANLSTAQTMRINLIRADNALHSSALSPNIIRLVGNPVFEHAGGYLYCDSAWLDEVTNIVDCYGSVHIKSSDTLNLYGKMLHYDGNTRIALLSNAVRLVDKQSVLTTDLMTFDRNTNIASYTTGGKIVNKDNVLTSLRGFYHTNDKEMFFKDNVVVKGPDYTMHSDTLKYNTLTRTAWFVGPTIIQGKRSNYISCEDGFYNTVSGLARFSKNALMVDGDRRLTGDSLFFNEKKNLGTAKKHIVLRDKAQDLLVKGNYAEYWRDDGFAIITDSAVALMPDKKDTLYLHADTLRATFQKDSTNNPRTKDMYAYHNARFYRNDIQGICDSLHFSMADSLITLHKIPVMWADANQLTADTIILFTGKNVIKLMKLFSSAFIISKDSLVMFNQIKGKNMIGYFTDNHLVKIDVKGNAETIYYVREDDKRLIGINKAKASDMRIYVTDNKIDRITYLSKPDGSLIPEKKVPETDRILKDFKWYGEDRPKDRKDIFRSAGHK